MQNQISPNVRSRAYKSVFFTSSLIVALCTIVVTASLTYMSYTASQRNTDEGVRIRAGEVTMLIAKQSGGALKFGKTEVFDGLFKDAFDGADGAATAGSVFQADGDLLSTHGDASAFGDGLDLLVTQSLKDGAAVQSTDGFTAVSPVRFGKDNAIVGAVAMRWTSEVLKAQHFQDQLFALLVAGGLGLAGLVGAAIFLFLHVSRPLVSLRDAMAEVAAEKYDTQVPGLLREDEVGEIARTLEQFRYKLNAAAETGRESVFKGAAFEGSNAAMMIVDQDLHIQYLNVTCQRLLIEFGDFFKSIDANFDADNLIGRPIHGFLDPQGTLRKIAADPKSLPYHSDIVAGERRVHLAISSVIDAKGHHTGCVLELKDVTEDHLNKAAIQSIDANQIRLEMSIDGKIISTNTNFSDAIGIHTSDLRGRRFDQLFRRYQYDGAAEIDLAVVRQGSIVSGRFAAQGHNGDVILEGNLNLVKDTMDRPLRLVFIGNDVTIARRAIEESRARQMSDERAQAEVVAALRRVLGRLSEVVLLFRTGLRVS